MRVVLSWLGEYADTSGVSMDELAERWTLAGLEVTSVERIGDWWSRDLIFVGAVVRVLPHPNADRLVVADVDYGAGSLHRIVTGAPVLVGLRDAGDLPRPMKVAFAMEGAELFDGHADGWVKTVLKGRPVRGVMSDAMVCSAKELGLADEHEDILVLDDDAPVGAPLAHYLGDAVFDIDITPNMARAMSVIGVARETAAILDRPFEEPVPVVEGTAGDVAALVGVEIADPDLCPRYTARVIRDVHIGPSPFWMARRLSLAGMRPISNVVDITNYVMLEWGEPLHAFDYDLLVGRAGGGRPVISVRRAAEGERMATLDGAERVLDRETLLIADDAGPLAIAGIMGGADTEIRDETRHILLEAASFEFINNRRTSRQQKLPSESAARFGRGVHPSLAAPASARAADLMRRLAGGTVVNGVADAYPREPRPVRVVLPAGEAARVLGADLSAGEIAGILRRLQFVATERSDGAVEATVPPHRMDVSCPADLLEEVARIHGYDRLPVRLLAEPLPPQRDAPRADLERAVQDGLAAAGLLEVVSYRLTSVEHEADLEPSGDGDAAAHVKIVNPISPERSAMRTSILTGLLDAARDNLRYVNRVALYEVGHVYQARADDLPLEPWRIGLVLSGPFQEPGWRGADARPMGIYEAKGVVEQLLAGLRLTADWQCGEHRSMHPARTASLAVDGAIAGHVGELHPVVRERWGLGDRAVAVADIDLDALASATSRTRGFQSFSPFPAIREDLAVIVEESVPAAEVASAIRSAGGGLLVDLALFDLYRGPQVGGGKKSLAWSLVFQAPDRTLTNEEAAAAREKIVRSLERRVRATIRK